MALHHAAPGEIVDLAHPLPEAAGDPSIALFRTTEVEVIRRVLQRGQTVPPHHVAGPVILHCLAGAVRLHLDEGASPATAPAADARTMTAGQLAFVPADRPYALQADADSILLMTVVRVAGAAPPHPVDS